MSVAAKVNIVLILLERSLDVLSAVRGGGADLENPEWRHVCVMAGGGVTPSVCPLSVLISHQPEVSAVNTSHILDLRNQIRPVTTSPSPSCPTIHCSSTSTWSPGAVGSSGKSPGGSTCSRFRSIQGMLAGSAGSRGRLELGEVLQERT